MSGDDASAPQEPRGVRILPMPAGDAGLMAAVDAIFFAASATQAFESESHRAAFRERWLGRYLVHDPDDATVALDDGGALLGYLVGARDDPARTPRFADIGYFAALADLTCRFPAHLHVNLAAAARSRGIGTRLVQSFCARLACAGVPGVHIVTGAASRNRGFYARLGFRPLRELDWNRRGIVMMGRRIDGP